MIGRIATATLAGAVVLFGPVGATIATADDDGRDQREEVAFKREEGDDEVATPFARDDDDDDDSSDDSSSGNGGGGSFTSGVNSNDGTDSRRTPVSRDRDRSRGDLTRDRTNDGPGSMTRDRTPNRTNDGSRHDTR